MHSFRSKHLTCATTTPEPRRIRVDRRASAVTPEEPQIAASTHTPKRNEISGFEARREASSALCCGSAGAPAHCLCCLSVSAGCNGLSNGSLLEDRGEKWASPPVRHSRSHYTPLEDHRAASHFRAVPWRFPRCERGGKTVWQLDSELLGVCSEKCI